MDVGAVRFLATPDGRALLRSLPPYDEEAVLGLQRELRSAGLAPDLVAAVLTQQRLRARAATKFGEFAQDMLFTSDGLEQASRLELAATHAGRFYNASMATVHDLGCGIGADAVAMSALGVTVQAVDVDPVTAAVADANLRPWPDSRARVGRAEEVDLPPDPLRSRVGVWLDPARRVPGVADAKGRTRRLFRLDELSPSWDFVLSVAARVPATGAKLAPSFPHDAVPLGTEAQWTSYGGTVLECALYWGPLAKRPGRSARVLGKGQDPVEVDETMGEAQPAAYGSLRGDRTPYLYEPDRALLQAGLLGVVTAATDGGEVDPGLGYVLSESKVDLRFAKRYLVTETMPLSTRALRGWVRQNGVTGLTIKKRGVRLDDDALRRELKVGRKAGDGAQATIVLTRVGGQQSVLVVEPG